MFPKSQEGGSGMASVRCGPNVHTHPLLRWWLLTATVIGIKADSRGSRSCPSGFLGLTVGNFTRTSNCERALGALSEGCDDTQMIPCSQLIMLNTANTDQGGIKQYQILQDQSSKTVKRGWHLLSSYRCRVNSNSLASEAHEYADSLVL